MATIDKNWLYSVFENFDKPTEYDFRKLIDYAGFPVTFSSQTVVPVTSILEDLNNLSFELDIREIYLIKYGASLYFLFGEEGTWGSTGYEITADNILLISEAFGSALEQNLTSNVTIGGIKSGQVFPAGTTFESLFRALLTLTSISSLNYQANNTAAYLEVNTTLSITKFTWTANGSPESLNLLDSVGLINTPVTGDQHNVNQSYLRTSFSYIDWFLSGSNVSTISKRTYWVEPSYYGKKVTNSIPTSAEILAGTKVLTLTASEIQVPISTGVTEYGWIAVEVNQTAGTYSEWFITDLNRSLIGPNEFIKKAGSVSVAGKVYDVYMFNYPSQVGTIKLT
jgi:hypothetical protein